MHTPYVTRDLVLVGGGHAHVEVLRRFAMQPEPGVRLTVISRDLHTPYSGMLPGLVAGHYEHDEVHIDLGPLALRAAARLYQDEVTGLDLLHGRVLCRARPPIEFDLLSIDTGSQPALLADGAAGVVTPVKPVSNFTARFDALLARVLAQPQRLRIGVVGGGAGGYEMVLAVRHRLLAELGPAAGTRLHFALLSAGPDILPGHGRRARALARAELAASGVELLTGAEVIRVEPGRCHCRDGRAIALDEILWVTHAAAPAWPREAGLAVDAGGFIRVEASLRSVSHPDVFAAGDIAAVDTHPRPKSGVFAVRQGPPLAANLRRALRGEPLQDFAPQQRFLGILASGRRHAIASRGRWAAAGDWVWRWKDGIDRRFMRRYGEELPPLGMAAPAVPLGPVPEEPRCGGCGSKVGAQLLREALAQLAPHYGTDVLVGLDAADDAAVTRPPGGQVAVSTIDGFRAFIDDPWLFGRIAAQHCLGDIHAMGATPRHALALVTLPLAAPARMRADLVTLLQGALHTFAAQDVALVGGHTSEGSELALGFSITGYAEPTALRRKAGAEPGDALVLTRALGSGVLLAAAMRGRGRSRWLAAALARMTASQAAAARCLVAHGARALTDVTGFGLAGHLLEMLDAGALGATVDLAALPLYVGAEEVATAGIASTLFADNLAAARGAAPAPAGEAVRHALCFDPQTAGGLLAALPAARAADCVAALHALGDDDAAVIGHCRERGSIALDWG